MEQPVRIQGERVLLTRMQSADAESLTEVLNRNTEHLAPWMPWALQLPQQRARTAEFLARCSREWEAGSAARYAIRMRGQEAILGGVGAHRRVGPGGVEIGYWLDAGHGGRGLATEAAALAVAASFRFLEAVRVEIHADPKNGPSLAVARRLGFQCEGILRARMPWPDGTWRDKAVTSLLASEFAQSPAAAIPLRAFDCDGRELPGRAPKPEVRS